MPTVGRRVVCRSHDLLVMPTGCVRRRCPTSRRPKQIGSSRLRAWNVGKYENPVALQTEVPCWGVFPMFSFVKVRARRKPTMQRKTCFPSDAIAAARVRVLAAHDALHKGRNHGLEDHE